MEKKPNGNIDSYSYQDGEIDLFDLWNGLVEEKWTVFIIFITVVMSAAVYAFSVTPVYKATSYLLPPTQEDVLPMNELSILLNANANANANANTYTVKDVFDAFKTNLKSRQNLTVLFDQYDLIQLYKPEYEELSEKEKIKARKEAFEEFVKNFSISPFNKKSELDGFSISLALPLPEQKVAKRVNELVAMAQKGTVQQLYTQISSEKETRERQLKEEIATARKVELDRRLDKLARLNEAIAITQSLNIQKPISKGPSLNINNVNRVESQNFPLYMLGSDLLMAEKKVLEARKNDDPFIENLRAWQQSLQQLENLKIDKDKFGVVRIDAVATYADKIKPKKSLILALSGLLGLMLGIFLALIRRAIKNRKEKIAAV
ncbi:MAG: hypothetical protein DSZ27_06410 [Thiomicrospira sp.]|nr:MAG: hypothetical protein DSZ27_06410 [Thiomicrospira sp.]